MVFERILLPIVRQYILIKQRGKSLGVPMYVGTRMSENTMPFHVEFILKIIDDRI